MKQKMHPARTLLLVSLPLFVALNGCEKDDENNNNPNPNKTITETVVSSADFSTLETAVAKANLQATLSGPGPFTVFAPNNAGFSASGISETTLNAISQQDVSNILLYHTLSAEITSTNVPAGPNAKVIAANGDSVFVTRNNAGVFVNGIRVEQADITASNGVIHQIGRVLLPPVGDLVATAQAPGSGLDSLVKAIVRANNAPGGAPTLIATLQSATLTLFAPTNAAFTQLLSALGLSDIDEIPVATLLAVLQYHVVPGRAFSSDLSNGSLPMLAGGNTTVTLNGGPAITGNGNSGNVSNILSTDIVARNGVVHVIDRVLLP